MKVVVVGATGGTGKLAIDKLLAQGHDVVAVARQPSSVPPRPRLTVVKGEARDRSSLEAALAGADAVFSALGPRGLGKSDLQEAYMRNLLAAMQQTGVKRLVNLSAWGAGDSRANSVFVMKIIRATLLKNVFDDKDRGELLLTASDVDWVNVRPGRLLDQPARGGVKANLDGAGIKPFLTRDDLADFMIAQLSDDAWLRRSPVIGY
jgi:uncharacterized protein YbjT (DUF2867 family)